jgi:hypothetical protein
MPHAGDFAVASCHATLFTPEAEVSSTRFVTTIFAEWANRFDADPTLIPLPDGVPKEFPKIILESRNKEWRCEVASARISLFWRRPKSDTEGIGVSDFYRTAIPMLARYREFVASPVRRLAALVNRYALTDDPGQYLARHFCQERWLNAPFNRPENFELHAHKLFKLTEDLSVNSWVRNKTAKLVDTNQPIVLVEQDLNTPEAQAECEFSEAGIGHFFEAASIEFDTILNLYYPADAA